MDYSLYAEEPPEDRTVDFYNPNVEGYYSLERLNGKVKINTETDCWECITSLTSQGYGQMRIDGKYWTTHRYALYCVADIPEGMHVRHKCHNTKCCNPDHLTWGTAKDNWKDSEEIHRSVHRQKAMSWIINETTYNSCRHAVDSTGLTMSSLLKYTNKETRVFDVTSYRNACKIARCVPKV